MKEITGGVIMNRRVMLPIVSIAFATMVVSAQYVYASSSGQGNRGIPSQIQALQNAVSSLEKTVTSQGKEITQLYQTVNKQTSTISGLQALVNEDEHNLQAVTAEVDGQQSSIANLNAEVGRLQQRVTKLESSSQSSTYTVSGSLHDVDGTPFFSPIYLVDSNGKSLGEQTTFNSATGQFSFANVPDGTYTFRFGMPEYQFSSPQITVNGHNVSNVTLTTTDAVYDVSGTATKNGQPLADQSVTVFDPSGYTGGYFGPGRTDPNGHFQIHGLPNGTYTIYIGIDWGAQPTNPGSTALASKTITVSDGNVTNLPIDGLESAGSSTSPQSGGYSVQGTLVNGDGQPFMTPIHLRGSNGQTYFPHSIDSSAGSFTFTNIPDGTYTLEFDIQEFHMAQPFTVTVNNQDVSSLEVKYPAPTYSVSGTAQLNGSPLVNQSIAVKDSTGTYGGFWGTTNQTGKFTIGALPAGSYTILIGADLSNPNSTAKVTATITVANSNITGLTIGN